MRKLRIPALDIKGAYQRSDFSEPRLWYLPIQRKAKFLNLRYLVFFNGPILQIWKWWHREVHAVGKWWSWDLNSEGLTLKSLPLTTGYIALKKCKQWFPQELV